MITLPAELRRDPSSPVTDIHMDYCSHQAKIIVDRIRAYLPVEGQEKDVEWHVQSNAYGDITACYGNIETVRNPGQSEFHPQRSSSYHVECYTSEKTPWARRAKDAEARLAFIDRQKDLQISLGGQLSSLEYAIVKYLWDRGSAPAAEIGRHCWSSEPSQEARDKAIQRTKQKLFALDCGVFIDGSKNDIVTLIKPDK